MKDKKVIIRGKIKAAVTSPIIVNVLPEAKAGYVDVAEELKANDVRGTTQWSQKKVVEQVGLMLADALALLKADGGVIRNVGDIKILLGDQV